MTLPVADNLKNLYLDREIFNGGAGGETSTQIATRMLADTAGHNTWINVFWYGQNNNTEPAKIKSDIAASVSNLAPGNTRFVVLSVVNKAIPEESRGGPIYAMIVQLNNELAALYPQNYMDIRTVLVNQYDPANPQEAADFQNDVPPSSLRGDVIHLSVAGWVFVASKLKEYFGARGW